MRKLFLIAALASVSVAGAATLIESKPVAGLSQAATQASTPAVAGRVATLSVMNVGCVSCGPIVTRTLSAIPGVQDVSVKEGWGASATVRMVYDQKKITPAALATATTNAGYPTRVINN